MQKLHLNTTDDSRVYSEIMRKLSNVQTYTREDWQNDNIREKNEMSAPTLYAAVSPVAQGLGADSKLGLTMA